jgi:DNA-binding NarL/FixJ family response regulator
VSIGVSIVEDDANAREILAGWIKSSRDLHLVSNYGTGERAVVRLPSDKPEIVLMDINLPGISGIECVRQLKQLLPDTQFLMLTVYEDSDYLFSALASGASGYLLKRTSPEELINAVKDVHSGGSPMSSNIARKVVQSFRREDIGPGGVEDLTPREREPVQGDCRPPWHYHYHGQRPRSPHLRKTSGAFARAGSCEIRPPVSARRGPPSGFRASLVLTSLFLFTFIQPDAKVH